MFVPSVKLTSISNHTEIAVWISFLRGAHMATAVSQFDFPRGTTPTSRVIWKKMFIFGVGFFTDLFIIGVVMTRLRQKWKISHLEESLVEPTGVGSVEAYPVSARYLSQRWWEAAAVRATAAAICQAARSRRSCVSAVTPSS